MSLNQLFFKIRAMWPNELWNFKIRNTFFVTLKYSLHFANKSTCKIVLIWSNSLFLLLWKNHRQIPRLTCPKTEIFSRNKNYKFKKFEQIWCKFVPIFFVCFLGFYVATVGNKVCFESCLHFQPVPSKHLQKYLEINLQYNSN